MSPRRGSTPRRTDWLTVSCNLTLTLTLTKWVSSEAVRGSNRCGGGLEYLHRSPAKTEPNIWWCNWATLFLGDINMGPWTSRFGESRIWVSKIWSWFPRDSDLRMTALARTNSNCKRQTRPLVREGLPHQQTSNCLTVIKIVSWVPDGCLSPRQTGRMTVCRNITLTWNE
jgi:hypothetical protein